MAINAVPETYVRQFHHNQNVWVARLATGETEPDDPDRVMALQGTLAMRPGASGVVMMPMGAALADILRGVDGTLAWLRRFPLNDVLVWQMLPDSETDVQMLARGFQPGFAPQWMTRDLSRTIASPTHEVRLATAADIDALAQSDLPYIAPDQISTTRRLTLAHQSNQVMWLVVRAAERVVGQAIVNITGDHAGLFNVGVSGRYRRAGIGSSLTLAAMQLARDAGAVTMNLNSTPMGLRLYARAGFVAIGSGQTWSAIGDHARMPTSPAEHAAVLAIGRGDVAEVATIENGAGPFACGLTPQQLAARFHQHDVLRSLIGSGEAADIIALWDAGLRDEAIAACNDPIARELATRQQRARPIHHAIERGSGTLVLALIRAGADLAARDEEYRATPLDWAHATNKPTIARIVRQAGGL